MRSLPVPLFRLEVGARASSPLVPPFLPLPGRFDLVGALGVGQRAKIHAPAGGLDCLLGCWGCLLGRRGGLLRGLRRRRRQAELDQAQARHLADRVIVVRQQFDEIGLKRQALLADDIGRRQRVSTSSSFSDSRTDDSLCTANWLMVFWKFTPGDVCCWREYCCCMSWNCMRCSMAWLMSPQQQPG